MRRYGEPTQVFESNRRGDQLSSLARSRCRLPGGHPEGFVEAFANIYHAGYEAILQGSGTCRLGPTRPTCPDVADGLEGVRFVHQCLASHQAGGAWVPLDLEHLAADIS